MKRTASQQLIDRLSRYHKEYRRQLTKQIGQRLKQARTEKKISIAELSRRTSLGTDTLTSYESGMLDSISCSSLYMLASEINVDLSWLISGNNTFSFMHYMNQGYNIAGLKTEIENALNDVELPNSSKKRLSNFLEQLHTSKTPDTIKPFDNPAELVENKDNTASIDNHSELVFAIQDQFHKFSLSLQTILDCLKIAESSGYLPPLPAQWWCSAISRHGQEINIKTNQSEE
ncbi:helix-turn-helix domain-containing protein [Maridesulfovibrio salexigens]|uniref:Transcriptional regulator, XRE family n=1 Tax=Maridesulfovibrio salexigens (strain ATCC 14822 / DSM 2638 / NCIMB 8403 / VKM B-1763) TaxID=526222 RepID=C6BT39_MARSD|nr:helix-turn-helix transcriptional regulator [Maridesulfovibrio salexigens]ACS79743.1 transcriptional regulator, XRE family [Maridesulfovibrio salexigens DSM 2638]